MSDTFLNSFKKWDATYGKLAVWVWRIVFYPVIALGLYAGSAYLDSHYVSKPHFDKAMTTLSDDKQHYALDQKQELKSISEKLDSLLLRDSANFQRAVDSERRLSRLEDKVDRLGK